MAAATHRKVPTNQAKTQALASSTSSPTSPANGKAISISRNGTSRHAAICVNCGAATFATLCRPCALATWNIVYVKDQPVSEIPKNLIEKYGLKDGIATVWNENFHASKEK